MQNTHNLNMNTAHDTDYEADYDAMLRHMQEETRQRKKHEANRITVLETRDLYDLSNFEVEQQARHLNGFEDLFDTEYLFSYTSANVNELSQFHT